MIYKLKVVNDGQSTNITITSDTENPEEIKNGQLFCCIGSLNFSEEMQKIATVTIGTTELSDMAIAWVDLQNNSIICDYISNYTGIILAKYENTSDIENTNGKMTFYLQTTLPIWQSFKSEQ